MFGYGQLNRLAQRKAVLLQSSDTNRRAVTTELEKLRSAAVWVDLGIDVARKARIGWSALSPWLSRRRDKPDHSGFVQKLAGFVSLARELTTLWKN